MLILIASAAFCSTLIGGAFALKLKDKLHLVLGFSAGAVVAVAFFDLLPEALELGEKFHESSTIITATAVGFLIYLVLDRTIFLHSHSDEPEEGHAGHSAHMKRGILGAGSLSFHSFLDGVAIGIAFQASAAVGIVVAAAVLAHDFSDGINTVNLILKNGGTPSFARRFLLVDAAAPVLGVIFTMFFVLPESLLSLVLAMFAGFFLYLGASDLIPESHHAHPRLLTTVMTVLGVVTLFIVIKIASI
jgi:ZIP family zinc transporter